MASQRTKTLIKLLAVFLFVYFFLVSIGLMETAFKGFGKDFAEKLIKTTSNPFIGLFIGILATSLVQSSSATTSVVIGMVASGVVTLNNAVPIIMGANIGTTVTSTLVSLAHIGRREEFKRAVSGSSVHDFFNIICVALFFPLEISSHFLSNSARFLSKIFANAGGIKFTSPLKIATEPLIELIRNIIAKMVNNEKLLYGLLLVLAITTLFVSLFFIVKIMQKLMAQRAEIIFNNVSGKHGMLSLFAGIILTAVIQSSSITTSLMVPLVAAGILTIEMVFPITLGANIGTTITAILASFATGNITAITVAFTHFLFNLTGVCCVYPIKAVRRIPIFLAKKLGELAFIKRRYAIIYIAITFFIIPAILIAVSRIVR